MKKTLRFLSMAALVLMGVTMTGCTSSELENEQPLNNDKKVTLTTTVGLNGGATKALDPATGNKTFAENDQIAVVYTKNGGLTAVAVSEKLPAGTSGNSATFTVTLDDPDKTKEVTFIYPAAMAKDNGDINYDALFTEQDGTLGKLGSNFDFCMKSGAWNSGNLPSLTLENQLSILAITLKDKDGTNDITNTITVLTVSDGTNTYAITRSAEAGPIYVAIRPMTSANVIVYATAGEKGYAKSLTEKTYNVNNGYNVSWRMAGPFKMADAADAGDQYKLICAAGHIHAEGEDADCPADRLAKIIYVGSSTGEAAPYNHGLALALTDESTVMQWNPAKSACSGKNTSSPVADASWMLPSKDQWNTMITAAGSFANLRTKAGLVYQTNHFYWSSTKDPDSPYGNAFRLFTVTGDWYSGGPTNTHDVRAGLAF